MENNLVTYNDIKNYLNDEQDNYEDEYNDIINELVEPLGDLTAQLMVNNTPDSFNVTPDSTTWKFWQGLLQPLYSTLESLKVLNTAHYVKYASDKLLDMWGKQYNVQRNGMIDSDYRIRIMIKIMATHSAGTKNDILQIVNSVFPSSTNMAYTELSKNHADTIIIGGIPSSAIQSESVLNGLANDLGNVVADGIAIETIQFEDNNTFQVKYGLLDSSVNEWKNLCK